MFTLAIDKSGGGLYCSKDITIDQVYFNNLVHKTLIVINF